MGNLSRPVHFALAAALAIQATARSDTITMNDGRHIDGTVSQLNTMQVGAGAPAAPATKLIVMVTDGLRRYYVPARLVRGADPAPPDGSRLEEFNVPQPAATAGQHIGGVGAIVGITPWDDFGRRKFTMLGGPTGQIDILQGITKITPVYCVVEALQTKSNAAQTYVWEMRIAASSIPRETLAAILERLVDKTNVDQRLKVVKLFLQQQRFRDAENELSRIIKEFPDRANLRAVAKEIKQSFAGQLLDEIETRTAAGQYGVARYMLDNFPSDDVGGQILQRVRAKIEEHDEQRERGETIVKQLAALAAGLPDSALREKVEPLVKEITADMRIGTLDRMATYRRFADDPKSTPEQKLSLAISGWLLGANEASENLVSTLAQAETRDLIVDYLRTNSNEKVKQDDIIGKIKKQEFRTPKLIAALLGKMKPSRDLPTVDEDGFYQLSVPSVATESDVAYFVQLPPEYDPHGSYPCVISLNGAGSTPQAQIEWWAGAAAPAGENRLRMGQASRHGYIIVAPTWSKPHQKQFESSAREHHAVLSVLRDACRHFAIDTDRVFVSGHDMGAAAAWEIGLAHPDLWAGVIPIVPPSANVMIRKYSPNAEFVPLYFVGGEKDGDTMIKNSSEFDDYINRTKPYDATIVEFLGRGHEHFSDEIIRIFDWMGRKRRNYAPREFHVVTQRETDSFFWWVELQSFQPPPRPMQIESRLTANNGISVSCGAKATVLLSPDVVDFSRPFTVTLNGRPLRGAARLQPDIAVILEDSRSRGERKHPFWAKLE
ncbi:MAG: peptidase [Pirellulales bacterium]|nr:peptidase [Pirellulales bacterium]